MTYRKRFTAFLLTSSLLTFGAFLVDVTIYGIFAGSISASFSVYATGQSWTDSQGLKT